MATTEAARIRQSWPYRLHRIFRNNRHYPRAYYEVLSYLFRDKAEWFCMNYGYLPEGGMDLPLLPEQERERLPLQLYHLVASGADLRGKDVLEISSGRGGGAAFVTRHHGPRRYVGMDVASTAVEFCRRQHQLPGLEFVRGDAMALPFGPESFDAVLNVEASHNYEDRNAVFRQIATILRPGGHFLYTDVLGTKRYREARAGLAAAGLKVLVDEDIAPAVLAAMRQEDARKLETLQRVFPRWFHPLGRFFTGTSDSYPYKRIAEGEARYFRIVAVKS